MYILFSLFLNSLANLSFLNNYPFPVISHNSPTNFSQCLSAHWNNLLTAPTKKL